MPLPFKVAATCLIRKGESTLFLDFRVLQTHPIHAGKISPPGGKVDDGEFYEDAARREALEETGIILGNLTYRGTVNFLNEKRTIQGKPMSHNYTVHFRNLHDFDDSNAKATEGELLWIPNHEVADYPLHQGDRIIWENWLKNYSPFEGNIIHEGERMTEYKLISYMN